MPRAASAFPNQATGFFGSAFAALSKCLYASEYSRALSATSPAWISSSVPAIVPTRGGMPGTRHKGSRLVLASAPGPSAARGIDRRAVGLIQDQLGDVNARR